MIMFGIDPQTRKFTEPPEQIKDAIAALRAPVVRVLEWAFPGLEPA